jgi:hypothetical protein
MQKIIQIYTCLLKLSRKQESVTDDRYYYISPHRYRGGIIIWIDLNNFLHVACNYHYLGWVLTWKYLKQGFWGEILVFG